MDNPDVKACEECGASIYPEHIGSNMAGYWGGKLFCVHCFKKHKDDQITIGPEEFTSTTAAPVSQPVETPETPAPPQEVVADEDLELSLSDEELEGASIQPSETEGKPPSSPERGEEIEVSAFTKPATEPLTPTTVSRPSFGSERRYKRHLNRDNKGALRCRVFHAKLNDGALRFVEEQINEWIDQNPEIEIKQSSTQVGVFEGKSAEPHLIITVFF